MDKIHICFFLEDRAQEGFIIALVKRIASEEGIPPQRLHSDVRSARYGSKVTKEFKIFVKQCNQQIQDYDILIVAIDGNCMGYHERIEKLKAFTSKFENILQDRILYAIPDPHIERWYLIDQRAFKLAVGTSGLPDIPQSKCKKDFYKNILKNAVSEIGSTLGGVEYGEEIVAELDLAQLEQKNAGFRYFVGNLRGIFRRVGRTE